MRNKIAGALLGAFLIFQSGMSVFAASNDSINIPDGYINSRGIITVSTSENESKELVSVRVKLNHGAYKDITDTKSFSVDENCTAHVKIKYVDSDGVSSIEEITKEIKNFDGVAPKVEAFVKGEDLTISIKDDISGVKLLNVDGIDYTELINDAIAINLKELEKTNEFFTIYAIDNAGNRTNTLKVNNPYYVSEDPVSNVDKGVDNPQSVEATKPTDASAVITSHTDESGEDLASVTYKEWKENSGGSANYSGSKQFFTIKTKSDKVFYIVVDESFDQQTAYLLTEASENDLLNFVNYDGNTVSNGETTVYTVAKDKKVVESKDVVEEDKEEPQAKENPKSNSGIIVAVVAIVGAVVYYFKFKKKDEDRNDEMQDYEEDFDNNLLDSERELSDDLSN